MGLRVFNRQRSTLRLLRMPSLPLIILAASALPGCGDSEDQVANPPEPPEVELVAHVLGNVLTKAGGPIAGAPVEVRVWRAGCGRGEPLGPEEAPSRLVTDTDGSFHAVFREQSEPFAACVTVEASPPPVYHSLTAADTGSTITFSSYPDTVEVDLVARLDLPIEYVAVSAGGVRTCGLSTEGAAFCWGRVNIGQFEGPLLPVPSYVPVPVAGGVKLEAIGTTTGCSCGLTDSGAAYCWGANTHGQLGNGTVSPGILTPVRAADEYAFTAITVGANHNCGTTADGRGLCWGNNFVGQLGNGSEDWLSPVATPIAGGLHLAEITAGVSATSCALATSGAAYCWGVNWQGSLGDGLPVDPDLEEWSTVPVPVVGGHSFGTITTGYAFSCGLIADGSIRCWGDNRWGQIGDRSTVSTSTPTEVPTALSFVTVAAGDWHACGLTAAGQAYCWGRNDHGQVGDGTTVDRYEPTRVQTEQRFTEITGGTLYTCALSEGRDIYCWGNGEYGQLGNAMLDDQLLPFPVSDAESSPREPSP